MVPDTLVDHLGWAVFSDWWFVRVCTAGHAPCPLVSRAPAKEAARAL